MIFLFSSAKNDCTYVRATKKFVTQKKVFHAISVDFARFVIRFARLYV